MRFGSVCSGIEAASVAWEPIGWQAAWFSEIEAFPSAVLQYHYPEVSNLGDMRLLPHRILSGEVEAPDILAGGTPCQAFSIAGLRGSLDDDRGNLTLTFCEIANAIDVVRHRAGQSEAIVFWENVPGVLSTPDNAFGCFLAGLSGEDQPLEPPGGKWTDAGAVFGPKRAVAWRILDAQFFGLAQRRKRVFVVASARAGFDPAQVLFEFDGLRRDSAPSRATEEKVAGAIVARAGRNGGSSNADLDAGHLIAFGGNRTSGPIEVSPALLAQPGSGWKGDFESETFVVQRPIAFHGSQDPDASYDVTHPVGRNQGQETCVSYSEGVRRLTPVECERLQGFPDGYTAIPWRGKPADQCPDGPRYKAIGNSWAVPVVRWIGLRIDRALRDHQ